jgi:hypothetical protein
MRRTMRPERISTVAAAMVDMEPSAGTIGV